MHLCIALSVMVRACSKQPLPVGTTPVGVHCAAGGDELRLFKAALAFGDCPCGCTLCGGCNTLCDGPRLLKAARACGDCPCGCKALACRPPPPNFPVVSLTGDTRPEMHSGASKVVDSQVQANWAIRLDAGAPVQCCSGGALWPSGPSARPFPLLKF